jgi:hypothetical protein
VVAIGDATPEAQGEAVRLDTSGSTAVARYAWVRVGSLSRVAENLLLELTTLRGCW